LSRSRLPFGLTEDALNAAMSEEDPESLAAASRMRIRYGPDLAAVALSQASLRRQARAKFGDAAADLFFTRAGLEQATRPEVADYHASRFLQAGVRRVIDLGCGIGSDSMAFLRAGLEVVAVDADLATAAVAQANLGGRAEVIRADASDVAEQLITPGVGVFCDPDRRNEEGRVWHVEAFEPRWSIVMQLLDGGRTAGVKLGPALPHSLIPEPVESEWITHRGETVEVSLWSGPGASPGRRSALIMPNSRLTVATTPPLPVRDLGRYLYEPAGAVIRAGAIAVLGAQIGAGLLDPQVAYLTSDQLCSTPFATAFEVRQRLPFHLKVLRAWAREAQIGVLEIKKRGIEVDPADLRRRLRLAGPHSATLVISRTPSGAIAAVVARV
jgi:SAM-dependent methyltransferase